VALTEVGVPLRVPGAFEVDPRMAVFDEILFSVGQDPPAGRSACCRPRARWWPSTPRGTGRRCWRARRCPGSSTPSTSWPPPAGAPGDGIDLDGVRGRIEALDPEAVRDPSSWWSTVWS
jgi:hypothetical protein